MRATLLTLFLGLLAIKATANDTNPSEYLGPINFQLIESEVDTSLTESEAMYVFEIHGVKENLYQVQYSINGVSNEVTLTKGRSLKILSSSGMHRFEVLVDGYAEVFSDSLLIQAGLRKTYRVSLTEIVKTIETIEVFEIYDVVDKPVIYLYPIKETPVSVKLDIHGTEEFLYPAYNGSWDFIANPNGDLVFDQGTMNYLFWEAKASNSVDLQDVETGFFVKNDNVISFLEEKLNLANLTTKEQADFITFWAPRLAQNDLNFVHFIFNETCDQYADIDIQPSPNSIYRIYMLWSPIDQIYSIEEQSIIPADRSGFTVIEWGGQEQMLQLNAAYISD